MRASLRFCLGLLELCASCGLLATSCSFEPDRLKLPYSGYAPRDGVDGWVISDPASEGMDGATVERAFRLLHSENLKDLATARSLLVARNGKLVAESYCADEEDANRLQCIWSATKSFTSLMLGIARDEGLVPNLDAPLSSIMKTWPTNDAAKAAITVRHALTMRSGLSYENSGSGGDDTAFFSGKPAGTRSYLLSLALESAPGTAYRYKNSDPQLIALLIEDATGESLASYADAKLFAPLGIRDYRWEKYRDGVTYGGFGLWLKPRDMLRFGELIRRRGEWGGRQIVSASWIDACTTAQTRTDNGRLYGYYWWVRPEFKGFTAWGHGGQYIYIIPSLALTIVFTADPDTDGVGADDLDEFERVVEILYRAAGGA
jgi:CubicO group peptidase (beta-lactamase class C family)